MIMGLVCGVDLREKTQKMSTGARGFTRDSPVATLNILHKFSIVRVFSYIV